jgi:hypothetical protein
MEIERKLRVFNDFLRRIDLIYLKTVKNSNKIKNKNKFNFLQLYLKIIFIKGKVFSDTRIF